MKPTQLRLDGGDLIKCWMCSKCRTIFSDLGVAERCCICIMCGLEIDQSNGRMSEHGECSHKRFDGREQKRLAEAELVNDWEGPVYSPDILSSNEGYYRDIGDFLDNVQYGIDNDDITVEDIPKRVFICKVTPFCLDLESAIENEISDFYEDAYGDLSGIEELEKAVRAFNEKNKDITKWYPESKKAMEVPEVKWETYEEERVS